MKRLLTLILILAMVPVIVLADLPDISELSTEELHQLFIQIQDILFTQQLEAGVLVPAGTYIVGVDIPAGDFRADTVSDVGGIVKVFENAEKYEEGGFSYLSETLLGNMWGTLTFRLKVEDGNILTIMSNSLRLYPYKGLLDFSEEKP